MNQPSIEALRNMVNRLHEISNNYDNDIAEAKKLHHKYTQQKIAIPVSFAMVQT